MIKSFISPLQKEDGRFSQKRSSGTIVCHLIRNKGYSYSPDCVGKWESLYQNSWLSPHFSGSSTGMKSKSNASPSSPPPPAVGQFRCYCWELLPSAVRGNRHRFQRGSPKPSSVLVLQLYNILPFLQLIPSGLLQAKQPTG